MKKIILIILGSIIILFGILNMFSLTGGIFEKGGSLLDALIFTTTGGYLLFKAFYKKRENENDKKTEM